MTGAALSGATIIKTNLSFAILTGAYLYGTARDDWTIDHVKCDFVFWDEDGYFQPDVKQKWELEHRVPKHRDFQPGEFEELYRQLPTFEYYFEQGLTPLDPLIMDQVVQAINERRPEIELKLATFDARGEAHATFTVLHKDNVEEALKSITAGYEMRLKVLEGQKEQLMQVVAMLGSGNVMLQPANYGFNVSPTIPNELTQEIIEFLSSLPGLATEDARQAWIYGAGLDVSLQKQIIFGGTSMQFVRLLVKTAISYGTLNTGKQALESILETAKSLVGQEKQALCDRLIRDCNFRRNLLN